MLSLGPTHLLPFVRPSTLLSPHQVDDASLLTSLDCSLNMAALPGPRFSPDAWKETVMNLH